MSIKKGGPSTAPLISELEKHLHPSLISIRKGHNNFKVHRIISSPSRILTAPILQALEDNLVLRSIDCTQGRIQSKFKGGAVG